MRVAMLRSDVFDDSGTIPTMNKPDASVHRSTISASIFPELGQRFRNVRKLTTSLIRNLEPEDTVIQTMPDVSPTKWHLAHTSWFFETFILAPLMPEYEPFDPAFNYLFNSYYNQMGQMHSRTQRGMLSRPSLSRVLAYREHMDHWMIRLLGEQSDTRVERLTGLGLQHEQQHQELLLTDIKHVLSVNPLKPACFTDVQMPLASTEISPIAFVGFEGGLQQHGHAGDGFCFDNELPRHQILLQAYELANRPVCNADYQAFIDEGGYRRSEWWLSEGWAWVQQHQVERPFYWSDQSDQEFTLLGLQRLNPASPVCHLNYYEADAFARWFGARLPTEQEWEYAASSLAIGGHFIEAGRYHPGPCESTEPQVLSQLFGDVWEWTASAYCAYPGYQSDAGAIGEYNGKFMCSQFVLKGGSCVSSQDHLRHSYRNFFYPSSNWQFTGVRLARTI